LTLFLVKLTLTPLLMALVSQASRRWGGAIGGLVAGLPLTSGPISIYLALEQGDVFAARAAVGSLTGLCAVTASYLVYGLARSRMPILVAVAVALAGFAISMGLLRALALPLAATLVLNIALIVAVFMSAPRLGPPPPPIATPAWDLPARIATSTAMVLLITLIAPAIGPDFSGLLAPIPVIAWPLIVFVDSQQGAGEATRVVGGLMRGAFGLVAFYAIVGLLLPGWGAPWAYALAFLGAFATLPPWFLPRPRRARAA
jgi:hypothetical protein